jgi:hypothetical protein
MRVTTEKVLESLTEPSNEPINWLLGSFISRQAKESRDCFLFDVLAGDKKHLSRIWNYWIDQFRKALTNRDDAPRKADIDLSAGKEDADEKLRSFMSEVFAVIRLKERGYKKITVILPNQNESSRTDPSPDYIAEFRKKRVRVEVKTLREPQDIVRTVVLRLWNERQKKDPKKYNFPVSVTCPPKGILKPKAISRIKEILDALPSSRRDYFEEVLDGNVKIRIDKIDKPASPPANIGAVLMTQIFSGEESQTRMVVKMPITVDDLDFDLDGFQRFFVKALRAVVDATPKFFGHAAEKDTSNLLVLQWEPPDVFVAEEPVRLVERRISRLFSNVGLNLKLMVFYDQPLVPTEVMPSNRN